MTTGEGAGGLLAALSDELARAVDRAAGSVVSVDARSRLAASGVVWRSGVVVTAGHVIEREEIRVVLPDGRRVDASLVGRDQGSDLAALRVPDGAGAPIDPAPRETVQVGHLAIALGRPGGGGPAASFGIVSSVGGSWRTATGGVLDAYVRADLSLLDGFSGGPLIDIQGRVIGLNSWHLAGGQAMAIPLQTAGPIVEALLAHGTIRRAYLGFSSQPVALPAATRAKLGTDQATGLMVIGVEAGSPADRAGLMLGDIVVRLGERAVTGAEDLRAALGPQVVDVPTPVVIVRGGERQEVTVTPGSRPDQ